MVMLHRCSWTSLRCYNGKDRADTSHKSWKDTTTTIDFSDRDRRIRRRCDAILISFGTNWTSLSFASINDFSLGYGHLRNVLYNNIVPVAISKNTAAILCFSRNPGLPVVLVDASANPSIMVKHGWNESHCEQKTFTVLNCYKRVIC
jgi:hypothetical protein